MGPQCKPEQRSRRGNKNIERDADCAENLRSSFTQQLHVQTVSSASFHTGAVSWLQANGTGLSSLLKTMLTVCFDWKNFPLNTEVYSRRFTRWKVGKWGGQSQWVRGWQTLANSTRPRSYLLSHEPVKLHILNCVTRLKQVVLSCIHASTCAHTGLLSAQKMSVM